VYNAQVVGPTSFLYTLLPYVEQTAVYQRAAGTGASYAGGNLTTPLKVFQCPADSSVTGGVSPTSGYATSSYSESYLLFGGGTAVDPTSGQVNTIARYTIGNIPDGTSNTVQFVERYGYYPTYGWSPSWAVPSSGYTSSAFYWGGTFGGYTTAYGQWGLNTPPQIGLTPAQAHPFYPNSGHGTTIQVALVDGSVRSVGAGVSATTWNYAVQPDDGQVLGSDW
jgi:hypothetical protein